LVNAKLKNRKLGVMQPYFFPYPGYFSMIKGTDQYVVFDTPQYTSRSFMNRNRILDPNSDGWIYITVPIKKHPLKSSINSIKIKNEINWKSRIISKFGYYKKHAPYYDRVMAFLSEILDKDFDRLVDLNIHTIRSTCSYLGIEFNCKIYSKMNLEIEPVKAADEWGLNICKAMSFQEFIYPERGQLFVDRKKYEDNNINLKFLEYDFPAYDQGKSNFVPGLSILDAMMFNSPSELIQMLDEYQLVN
jgi:hypothetical protein